MGPKMLCRGVPLLLALVLAAAQDRVPWDGSRMEGTPEPPPPYRSIPAWPNLKFDKPIELVFSRELDRFVLAEVGGKFFSFKDGAAKADLCIDLSRAIKPFFHAYGFAFHPRFAQNRFIYVCYVTKVKQPEGTRVSRFTIPKGDPPKIDVSTEQVLFTWRSGGHNGGCLRFGPDGFLYVSTGDAAPAFPPDGYDTGQDLADLPASVLRIDVDGEKPYRVPPDNPFVGTPGARGEVWAYGLRNPWKMSFDAVTGDLWVGDVGWEMRELIYRVERGGNYGWPILEGSQSVRPDVKRGPTPILSPVVEHPHTEARSITGGFVYRGTRRPDLAGAYVYGDYVTGKIWALRHENRKLTWRRELAETSIEIICFALDAAGELLIVDYGGAIHRLEPNPDAGHARKFPTLLSGTGLFGSTRDHAFAPGVAPYRINAEAWADGATAQRFIALPGTTRLGVTAKGDPQKGRIAGAWSFPEGAVLGKTLSLGGRRIETQVLHRWKGRWRAYTYVWNDEQTNARLADARGFSRTLTVKDRGRQTWRVQSRAECMTCHNNQTGNVFGFTLEQLDRDGQVDTFGRLGFFEKPPSQTRTPLPSPYDPRAGLEARARSYLHVNCSHCHRRGAGGTAAFESTYSLPLEKTRLIDQPPVQGEFGVREARVVAPGNPYRSVLYYRMAKLGRGRMPHLGSTRVDRAGLRLIHDWIRGMADPPEAPSPSLDSTEGALRLLRKVDDDGIPREVLEKAASHPRIEIRDLFLRFIPEERREKKLGPAANPSEILALAGEPARGMKIFSRADTGCAGCHRIQGKGREFGPDLDSIGARHSRAVILEQILEPSKAIHPDYLAYRIRTKQEAVLTGLILKRTRKGLHVREAPDKTTRVAVADIDTIRPGRLSAMPERLLQNLTAQEAADLLAYLESLR